MKKFLISVFCLRPKFSWRGLAEFGLILLGALIQAIGLRLFMVPAQLVNGGISGLSQIIHHFTGFPIGVMIFLGNVPLFLLGWRYLGGPRFALRTAFAVTAVSFLTEAITWLPFFPTQGLTQDTVLNSLFGGVVCGVGYGLVYRGQATSGGSDILARMLTNWWNVSISQSYMMTDSLIMLLAGLAFSWEKALYALVSLYVSGLSAEAAMEGSNVVRTALIITHNPDRVTHAILTEMERGVTVIAGRGAYTGEERTVLYSVVTRSEVVPLKELVRQADPKAFIVIGQAHEALGEGFKPLTET